MRTTEIFIGSSTPLEIRVLINKLCKRVTASVSNFTHLQRDHPERIPTGTGDLTGQIAGACILHSRQINNKKIPVISADLFLFIPFVISHGVRIVLRRTL